MNAFAPTSTTVFDEAKVVRDGKGQFSEKNFRDAETALDSNAELELEVRVGDQFGPILEQDAKVMVEDLFRDIDAAWVDERNAQALMEKGGDAWLIADGEAAGKAHSSAVAIAALMTDPAGDPDFESIGEDLLDRRREGEDLEAVAGWTGPGEIDAVRRAKAVKWLRDRAQLIADVAEQDLPADAIAYQHSRAIALEDAADKIAGVNV